MLYLHFCSLCNRIHILSGHRRQCPACDNELVELSVPYEKYIKYTPNERKALLLQCTDSHSLIDLRTEYISRYQRKRL